MAAGAVADPPWATGAWASTAWEAETWGYTASPDLFEDQQQWGSRRTRAGLYLPSGADGDLRRSAFVGAPDGPDRRQQQLGRLWRRVRERARKLWHP